MNVLYDALVFLYALLSLPKFLIKKRAGAKYALSVKELLGIGFPSVDPKKKKVWIHAVSVGEAKVAATLLPHIKKTLPDVQFVVTCATKTGVERAKQLFPKDTICQILPLDFSFLMRRLVHKIQPSYLMLSESDFWPQLLFSAKAFGAKIFLINGKLSERSFARYKKVPRLSKRLFGVFDRILVQNEEYQKRFLTLVPTSSIDVTGNMKYDASSPQLFDGEKTSITFGSTHEAEEDALLDLVKEVHSKHPNKKIYFAPRHPERFDAVASKMESRAMHYARWTTNTDAPIILVDTMGKLVSLYARSRVSIIAGSFHETLQGHDIFEPVLVGSIPVFGPYMNSQKEMTSLILSSDAGYQVSIETLAEKIDQLLQNEDQQIISKGATLLESLQGSSKRTWELVACSL